MGIIRFRVEFMKWAEFFGCRETGFEMLECFFDVILNSKLIRWEEVLNEIFKIEYEMGGALWWPDNRIGRISCESFENNEPE